MSDLHRVSLCMTFGLFDCRICDLGVKYKKINHFYFRLVFLPFKLRYRKKQTKNEKEIIQKRKLSDNIRQRNRNLRTTSVTDGKFGAQLSKSRYQDEESHSKWGYSRNNTDVNLW